MSRGPRPDEQLVGEIDELLARDGPWKEEADRYLRTGEEPESGHAGAAVYMTRFLFGPDARTVLPAEAEIQQITREMVARLFGVPPGLFGASRHVVVAAHHREFVHICQEEGWDPRDTICLRDRHDIHRVLGLHLDRGTKVVVSNLWWEATQSADRNEVLSALRCLWCPTA